jgi:hypothetical protein
MRVESINRQIGKVEIGFVKAPLLWSEAAQALKARAKPQMARRVNGQTRYAIAGQPVQAREAIVVARLSIKAQYPTRSDCPNIVAIHQQATHIAHTGKRTPLNTRRLSLNAAGEQQKK